MEKNTIWEDMANRYDTEDRANIAKIIAETIRSELKDTKQKTALDYGCGTGLVGLELADQFQSILLVDPSVQMIKQVDQKIKERHIECASTLCCDFLEVLPDALQFDYVIMSQVLLHIRDSRLILTRLYSVLKQGGHLLIADFDKNESVISDMVRNGFVQSELKELLRQIGFEAAESRTFLHRKRMFMNEDASLFILNAVK